MKMLKAPTPKRRSPEFIVLEELGDDDGLEPVGVPDDEGEAVVRPGRGGGGGGEIGGWAF